MSRWPALVLAFALLVAGAGLIYGLVVLSEEPASPPYRTPQPEEDATCEVWRALPDDQHGKAPEKCAPLLQPLR